MTAEIAIMNNLAIALAADSAKSVVNGKVFEANKLFSLSQKQPVAIMIYQSASIGSIPWETLIKSYRKQLQDASFATLDEYADDFIRYLNNDCTFPVHEQKMASLQLVWVALRAFLASAENDKAGFLQAIQAENAAITQNLALLYDDFDEAAVKAYYASDFDITRQLLIKNHGVNLTDPEFLILKTYCSNLLAHKFNVTTQSFTGLVFAGFGDNEFLPAISLRTVESFVNTRLRVVDSDKGPAVGTIALPSNIYPFAQKDMTLAFLRGINPETRKFVIDTMSVGINGYATQAKKILSQNGITISKSVAAKLDAAAAQSITNFETQLDNFSKTEFTDLILSVVVHLSPTELAKMALAMIQLTSLKRRTTPVIKGDESLAAKEPNSNETVGGPVDVAIITKGDGLVWIERKHYFDPELNLQFVKNYIR